LGRLALFLSSLSAGLSQTCVLLVSCACGWVGVCGEAPACHPPSGPPDGGWTGAGPAEAASCAFRRPVTHHRQTVPPFCQKPREGRRVRWNTEDIRRSEVYRVQFGRYFVKLALTRPRLSVMPHAFRARGPCRSPNASSSTPQGSVRPVSGEVCALTIGLTNC
jgi:hypothetical protein